MTTKFTMGPWHQGNQSGTDIFQPECIFGANGNAVCSIYGIYLHSILADVSRDVRLREPLANAHLIAAAPEMYEALQSVLPHLLDETQQPLADGIRLVLAKAEGGAR